MLGRSNIADLKESPDGTNIADHGCFRNTHSLQDARTHVMCERLHPQEG